MTYRELSGEIIGAAIEVHRELGPGILESIYEHCLAKELTARGLHFLRQHPIPVRYKGEKLDQGFKLDLWVEQQIIVEIKAVDIFQEVSPSPIAELSALDRLSPWLADQLQ